jgi:superfamily II DNA helicase RecQ
MESEAILPHPLWYRLYTRTTDVVWLHGIIVDHAAAVTHAAVQFRALDEEERQRDVLEFELIGDDDDDDDPYDDGVVRDDSVPIDAPLSLHLDSGAKGVFKTNKLRPKQQSACETILCNPKSGGRLLVVDRTGGGKSLILCMTAITIAGITLVIVPLLALTANQLARIRKAIQKYGVVSCYHMDDTSSCDLHHKIIPKMDDMPVEGCSSTMILLCSPQYLADITAFRLAVIRNIERRVVRMVAIDEAHLYAAHGRSFRESIRVLREVFFKVIYTVDAEYTPPSYS